MKTMRTVFSLFLALTLLLATVPMAMATDDPSEQVTLRWVTIGPGKQADFDRVLEAFNEKLKDVLPNTTLNLESYGDYDAKWPLMMAASEPIDIAWSGFAFDVASEIAQENYLSLNDLIAEYGPNIQKEMEIWPYEYTTMAVNGDIYGIPLVQPYIQESMYFQIPEVLLDSIDHQALLEECWNNDHATEKEYEIIDAFLQDVYSKDLVGKDGISKYINPNVTLPLRSRFEAFDNVSDSAIGYFPCDDEENAIKVVCKYESDDYKLALKYMSKWYAAGYIREDILTNPNEPTEGITAVIRAWDSGNWNGVDPDTGLKYFEATDNDAATYKLLTDKPANRWNGATKLGYSETYITIPYTSTHPERAMMLIDLLHATEGDGNWLYNLLCYGFEGEHYDFTNEAHTRIQPYEYTSQGDSTSKYGQWNWVLGNNYYAYETPNLLEGDVEYAFRFNSDVKAHWTQTPVFGMSISNEGIEQELAQVAAVWKEYRPALEYGVLTDWEPTYNEMMTKAYAAGLQTIIDCWQAQADAYCAAK